MGERIQKVLASLGYGSRREIERWIEAGRVEVNGRIIGLGTQVEPDDRIRLDGKPVDTSSGTTQTRVLIYHKPTGEIATRNDPEGRPTVFDNLPRLRTGRWISIGRLDINSSGLMLFTNNGELANRLMHPSYEIEREYAVRVLGEVTDSILNRLKNGVELDDGIAKFVKICDAGGQGANHWYHVTLREGRNREVRRMWEAVDRQVSRLHRIRYGEVSLPRSLRQGQFRELEEETTDLLLKTVGLSVEKQEPVTTGTSKKPAGRRRKNKRR